MFSGLIIGAVLNLFITVIILYYIIKKVKQHYKK
jgi:hypothetical protein